MYKHLIVSGCSFTKWAYKTWPDYLANNLGCELINLAHPGSGNYYIRRSLIDHLRLTKPDPSDTLVMIMWSGITRRDVEVSEDFVNLYSGLQTMKLINGSYFAISGGMDGRWQYNKATKTYFEWLYKLTDNKAHWANTLDNLLTAKEYLDKNKYTYYFLSYTDNFTTDKDWSVEEPSAKGCSPGYEKDLILDDNWITEDLYSFAKSKERGFSTDNYHPNTLTHEQFFKEVILPRLQ